MLRRPQVRELVPDLKLVLLALTVSCESHAGVYIPGGLAEDAGLDPGALSGALEDLVRRGHIVTDQSTGEIFLVAFYRDNKFNGKVRHSQWAADFLRIQSPALRELAIQAVQQSPSCSIPREVYGRFLKKQAPTIQGKGKGKEEPSSDADASPAAALQPEGLTSPAPSGADSCASAQLGHQEEVMLEARLTDLARKAGSRPGSNEATDRKNINALRALADELGGDDGQALVLAAISDQSWPAGARRAAEMAGLFDLAARRVRERQLAGGESDKMMMLKASSAMVDVTGVPPGVEGFATVATSLGLRRRA
jgi:hypothetical protein